MRGCQKRVVYMKNPGSPVFEEAYFILSGEGEVRGDEDIIGEANRIIEENMTKKEKKINLGTFVRAGVIFAAGFLSSAIILFLITMT